MVRSCSLHSSSSETFRACLITSLIPYVQALKQLPHTQIHTRSPDTQT